MKTKMNGASNAHGRPFRTRSRRRHPFGAAAMSMLMAISMLFSVGVSPSGAHDIGGIPGATAVYNPNAAWPPNANAGWHLPVANPPLVDACGINVGILIDRSGSIADAGAQYKMRNSAKSIVDLLAGTPSNVGVWSFGNMSSSTGTTSYPARQLTSVGGVDGPAGVTALKSTIDSIPIVTNQATNWEAGFKAVHEAAVAAGNAPELLIVLTDGRPTVHNDNDATGGVTNNDDVDGGIVGANLVKGDSTHVLGVGIGSAVDATTLGLVASPIAFDGTNIKTAGYTITDFNNLQTALKALVVALCGGTVSVQKLVDGGNGQFLPAPGWDFTLHAKNNPTLPDLFGTTDSDGLVNIDFDLAPGQTETGTLTETQQPGYRFLGDVTCTNSSGPNPTLTPITNGVEFDVSMGDILSCTFRNQRKTIDLGIAKSDGGVTAKPGENVPYTITYGNAGNTDAPNSVITETVPANASVDLGTGPADGINDGWLCGPSKVDNGVFPAGTVCTYDVGTVVAGASGLTVVFTVIVAKPFPSGVTQITNTAVIDYDGSSGPDTNPQDNTTTDTTPVTATPRLDLLKTVAGPGKTCPSDAKGAAIEAGQTVTYCYTVTNPGDTAALNVSLIDDNGTPADTTDDYTVTLTGLTELGGGSAKDLAGGASATGQATKTFSTDGTVVNTATATADGGLTSADTAQVCTSSPCVTIVKTAVAAGDTCPGIDGVDLMLNEGDPVRYCYVVKNVGTANLLNVVVTDDNGTPADLTDDFAVTLTGLAELGGGSAKDLAAGSTATGNAGPFTADAGTITNTATVKGSSVTGKPYTDSDPATVVRADTIPEIVVTKSDDDVSVAAPGGYVDYTVTVQNKGNEDVTITTMTDSISGGTPFSILSPAVAPVISSTCTTAVIVAGDTYSCVFRLALFGDGSMNVTDAVTVVAVDNEKNPTTDTDDDETPVTPVADLSVVKSIDKPSLAVGDTATYSIEVTNNGPSTATDVVVTDQVPAGLTVVSVDTPAGWTCTGTAPLTCTIASLASGESATITFVVRAEAAAVPSVTNPVDVTATEPDNDPDNNHDEVTTPVTPVVDLSVVKSIDKTSLTVGETATYSLAVTNNGPSTATNVVVTDQVPAGLTVLSVDTPAGWTCTGTAPLTCTIASLASGESATITFEVRAEAAAVPSVTNPVDVTATEPDNNPDNNHDEVTTPITPVTPPPTTVPSTVPTTAPPTTPPTTAPGTKPTAVARGPLPVTGARILGTGMVGLAALAAGLVLLAGRRRRREA